MNQIRSFSGEYPRKIAFESESKSMDSFEDTVLDKLFGLDSSREKAKTILRALLADTDPFSKLDICADLIVDELEVPQIAWKESPRWSKSFYVQDEWGNYYKLYPEKYYSEKYC